MFVVEIQKEIAQKMENMKNNNNSNGNNRTNGKEEGIVGHVSFPVHSQVRKIKQESGNIIDWLPGQPEMRPVLREITRQISRSPLGISC
jgi:hypothetical protein